MSWRPEPTADGSWTLVSAELGEACHSRAGAWQQATERYARPCRLGERARAGELSALHLLDVGTGLGLNLAAALAALDGTRVPLHAVTLERDPEVIARGLELYERAELTRGPWAPWHARLRPALRAALARPGCETALDAHGGTLVLRLGDARETLRAGGAFDAVFLDPFSPRRAPELWQAPFLAEVARRMRPGAWLSTYSASFAVRVALARAGLLVGRGPRVGTKGEGTLACPDTAPPPLPERVARRLAKQLPAAEPPLDPTGKPFRTRAREAGPFLGIGWRDRPGPFD